MDHLNQSSSRTYGAINNGDDGRRSLRTEYKTDLELMEFIRAALFTLNENASQIKKYNKIIGTPKDNDGLRNKAQTLEKNSKFLCVEGQKALKKLVNITRGAEKATKLKSEMLCENFREIANNFSIVQKEFFLKMKKYPLPQLSDAVETAHANATTSDKALLLAHQRNDQNTLEFERDLIIEREMRMKEIEEDVLDFNQIIKELNAMVNIQGESIVSIEDAIDRTSVNVVSGTDELDRFAATQRKRRMRKACCYGVIIVFFILVVVFIILQS